MIETVTTVDHVAALRALTGGASPDLDWLEFSGLEHILDSPFAVTEAAAVSVGAAALAAAELFGGSRWNRAADHGRSRTCDSRVLD